MTEDEKFVREQWPQHTDYCGTPHQPVRILTGPDGVLSFGRWEQAAEFTRTRLEQIREIEEEIATLESFTPTIDRDDLDTWAGIDAAPDDATIDDCATIAVDNAKFQCRIQRILAREQAALADLKRGMRVAE